MERKGYTIIPDWMLSLDLDVYETIILAVIFGFSQDGESTFSGSIKYLSQKAKCSRRKVTMALPKLVEMGLVFKIDKDVRGLHLCEYQVSPLCIGSAPHAQGGDAPHAHNNIENNNIDISICNKESRSKFQKPTLSEVSDYCRERGNKIDPAEFIDHYESNGWMVGKNHMKDWKAAVRTWEKREKEVPQRKRENTHKESVLEHNLKVMDELFGTDLHKQAYGNNQGGDIDEQ